MRFLALACGIALGTGLFWIAWVSWREGERRACGIGLALAAVLTASFLAVTLVPLPGREWIAAALCLAVVAAGAVLITPRPDPPYPGDDRPGARIDERTIMFSRALYEPGSERFERYYREHPEHRKPDEGFRIRPGLLQPGSAFHDPVMFAAAEASFAAVENLHAVVDGDTTRDGFVADAAAMTRFVEAWARKLGAVAVGVCELRDDHYYTTVGRGERWGDPVAREHRFGIALTVEMDKAMIDRGPAGPTVMESAQQYLAAGAVAVQLAELCRRLGWPARAHIDGNYRVVCPLVARDAGLGEIGRMGLLMTPELGPRVRIAVVTTDLPLVVDEPRRSPSTLDFCRICRKCADICPAHAIPHADPQPIDGARRWRIDQEACYTYWCQAGTDCARCVTVCPFSHSGNSLHRLVRWGVSRNALFRRFALRADDLFYGRRPRPRPLQEWVRIPPAADSSIEG